MRILHINERGDHAGGAEAYIAEAIDALRRIGHESHLVHSAPMAGRPLARSTRVPCPDWPMPIAETIRGIERVLLAFRPEVAYLHEVYHPELVRWIAARLPTVCYIHGPYPVCPGNGQYLRGRARACPRRAGLACLLSAQTERCCWGRNPRNHLRLLRRTHRFTETLNQVGRILVGSSYMTALLLRGGVASSRISLLAPILLPDLPPFVEDSGSRRVLFAGRLVPEKGLPLLLRAMANAVGDWQLTIAGDGVGRPDCQALAERLGIAERVQFAGWVEHGRLQEIFRSCAVVAVPSLWPEPFGRVGPEAFSAGRPVVAFASGGIPDWLEDGQYGYLLPSGDVAGLGQRIEVLLQSPALRKEMGERARARAGTAWSAPNHAIQLTDHFEAAIRACPGAA